MGFVYPSEYLLSKSNWLVSIKFGIEFYTESCLADLILLPTVYDTQI